MKLAGAAQAEALKLAAIGAAVLAVLYLINKATKAGAGALGAAVDSTIAATNPANPQNIVNRGVTAIGGAVVSDTGPGRNADGSWTFGGFLYDVTH